MSSNGMQCPNCTFSTLGFSKKRGTYRCWTCGYEALDDVPHPNTEANEADILRLLSPESAFPMTLTANNRATIYYYIKQLESKVNGE